MQCQRRPDRNMGTAGRARGGLAPGAEFLTDVNEVDNCMTTWFTVSGLKC